MKKKMIMINWKWKRNEDTVVVDKNFLNKSEIKLKTYCGKLTFTIKI